MSTCRPVRSTTAVPFWGKCIIYQTVTYMHISILHAKDITTNSNNKDFGQVKATPMDKGACLTQEGCSKSIQPLLSKQTPTSTGWRPLWGRCWRGKMVVFADLSHAQILLTTKSGPAAMNIMSHMSLDKPGHIITSLKLIQVLIHWPELCSLLSPIKQLCALIKTTSELVIKYLSTKMLRYTWKLGFL